MKAQTIALVATLFMAGNAMAADAPANPMSADDCTKAMSSCGTDAACKQKLVDNSGCTMPMSGSSMSGTGATGGQ